MPIPAYPNLPAFVGWAIIGAIVAIAVGVTQANHQQWAAMEEFVRDTCSELGTNWPERNYLVWHNHGNNPHENFIRTMHVHTELDIPAGTTEGYEIHHFESGWFVMVGDRGWINWGFGGNFIRDPPDGAHVTFSPIEPPKAYTRSLWQLTGPGTVRGRGDSTLPAWNSDIHQKTEIFQRAPKPGLNRTGAPLPEVAPSRSSRLVAAARAAGGPILNDGTYFVYCNTTDNPFANSGIAYYRDMQPGNNTGQLPDDFVWVEQNHSPFFRKSIGAAEFSAGSGAVHWSLFGNAMDNSTKPGDLAGVADDGIDHFFMYKDEGKELFKTEQYACFSQYYAY